MFNYKRHKKYSYKISKNEIINQRDMHLISQREVKSLIPPNYNKNIFGLSFEYDLRNYYPIDNLFNDLSSTKDIFYLLIKFLEFIDELKDKNLNYKNIMFDFQRVYYEPNNFKLKFIYIPTTRFNSNIKSKDFILKIIHNLIFKSNEDLSNIEKLIAKLDDENITNGELIKFLRTMK